MKRYEKMVKGILVKMAPDWNDTADLTQEVFIRVWRGIDKLQNTKAFKSWLCQIATHLFYDELRKDSRRNPALSLDKSMSDEEENAPSRDVLDRAAGPEELLLRKDVNKLVQEAVETLPEQFKKAMILRDLEDMTYEQIASITESDLGTVKSRISRARLKVQKVLRPHFGQDDKISA